MRSTPRPLAFAALLVVAACNQDTPPATTDGPSTNATTQGPGTGPTTTTGSSTTSTTTSSSSTTGTATTDSCDFICMPDAGPPDCDPFQQDCPDGEKCLAYDQDGNGAWDSLKCTPVIGDGMTGDPCTADTMEGTDDCAKGYMCWYLDEDSNGTCQVLCTGSAEAPTCPECTHCALAGDGVLTLCLPGCDPLAPNCTGDRVCIGNPMGDGFVCVTDGSGGMAPVGTPCDFANVCNPGLFCASPQFFPYPGCEDSLGCCATFCDLTQGQGDQNPTCQALEGQVPGVECLPWFEDEPPGECFNTNVGTCGLPQP